MAVDTLDARSKEMERMSQQDRIDQNRPLWAGPSEPESHAEHQAALDATLFRALGESHELVFELDAGELRALPPQRA